MGRSKKGRCVKKNKHLDTGESEDVIKAPHSFVIHRGLPGEHIVELTKDFRKVMEPFTAVSLKERKKNTIKDFASVAGLLHVSHMCIISRTEMGMYLKLCRFPRGPTLTFKIHNFILSRDVISASKKQMVFDDIFKNSPLIVLNNFSGEGMQMKLMASTFQNMFPTINLTTVNLNTIRRCLCLNYNTTTKTIDFRHYAIKVAPIGVSKGVKKLVEAKIPNLAKCENYSEFFTKTPVSESENENDTSNHIQLSQKLSSRGNHEKGDSAIKLFELGPRLTLQLMKIEDGLLDGSVLFHDLIHKSEEEKLKIEKARQEKKKLKEMRKRIQKENKEIKEKEKEESKKRSMKNNVNQHNENDVNDDDDAEYYREQVGQEPDEDLFQKKSTKRKINFHPKYKVKSKKQKKM